MRSRNAAPAPRSGNESGSHILGWVLRMLKKKMEARKGEPAKIGSDIFGVDETLVFTPGSNDTKEK